MDSQSIVRWMAIAMCMLWSEMALAKPVTVSSLSELLPYLGQDKVELNDEAGHLYSDWRGDQSG